MEKTLLTPEVLLSKGWEINKDSEYYTVLKKIGKRYRSQYTNVMYVGFGNGRITMFYYDDVLNHRMDLTLPYQMTTEEFNNILDLSKLTDFKIY